MPIMPNNNDNAFEGSPLWKDYLMGLLSKLPIRNSAAPNLDFTNPQTDSPETAADIRAAMKRLGPKYSQLQLPKIDRELDQTIEHEQIREGFRRKPIESQSLAAPVATGNFDPLEFAKNFAEQLSSRSAQQGGAASQALMPSPNLELVQPRTQPAETESDIRSAMKRLSPEYARLTSLTDTGDPIGTIRTLRGTTPGIAEVYGRSGNAAREYTGEYDPLRIHALSQLASQKKQRLDERAIGADELRAQAAMKEVEARADAIPFEQSRESRVLLQQAKANLATTEAGLRGQKKTPTEIADATLPIRQLIAGLEADTKGKAAPGVSAVGSPTPDAGKPTTVPGLRDDLYNMMFETTSSGNKEVVPLREFMGRFYISNPQLTRAEASALKKVMEDTYGAEEVKQATQLSGRDIPGMHPGAYLQGGALTLIGEGDSMKNRAAYYNSPAYFQQLFWPDRQMPYLHRQGITGLGPNPYKPNVK